MKRCTTYRLLQMVQLMTGCKDLSYVLLSNTQHRTICALIGAVLSQANTTAAIRESLEMQQACLKLYNELEGIDGLAKDVHSLRKKVERLESDVTAKLRVR